MAEFVRPKEMFLRQTLRLAFGLPTHDTFSRLFRSMAFEQFRAAFQRFMAAFSEQCQGVVMIDGKVLLRSFDRATKTLPLHMVSAWGCKQRMVLAQIATAAKSNEITAVPKLLAMLSLRGTIVTTDALNCQRAIAAQIVAQGGDYAVALEENQPSLHADVTLLFDDPDRDIATAQPDVDAGHGRIETRTASVLNDIKVLCEMYGWPGLAPIGKVERVRQPAEKTSTALSPERLNEVVRSHWGVENPLHWRLDVVINEDQSRTRVGHGPHNMAILRHMALNMMHKDSTKGSLGGKFKRAGWNDASLTSLPTLC